MQPLPQLEGYPLNPSTHIHNASNRHVFPDSPSKQTNLTMHPIPTQQPIGLETTANTGDQDGAAITQPKNVDATISITPIAAASEVTITGPESMHATKATEATEATEAP